MTDAVPLQPTVVEVPAGCGVDADGCFVEGARREWGATVALHRAFRDFGKTVLGGCLGFLCFAILPGILFGFSALFGAGMVEALGLVDSVLAYPAALLFILLFCLFPYSPLLWATHVVPRLFRQEGPTLRADSRHLHMHGERFPRETTTLHPDAGRLRLQTEDGPIHVVAQPEQIDWFLQQLVQQAPVSVGEPDEVPQPLHGLTTHEPDR
jgi:hypothetical protein